MNRYSEGSYLKCPPLRSIEKRVGGKRDAKINHLYLYFSHSQAVMVWWLTLSPQIVTPRHFLFSHIVWAVGTLTAQSALYLKTYWNTSFFFYKLQCRCDRRHKTHLNLVIQIFTHWEENHKKTIQYSIFSSNLKTFLLIIKVPII